MSEERHDAGLKRESQEPDAQDKDTMERVEKQEIKTKEVTPDKRGDVRPKDS